MAELIKLGEAMRIARQRAVNYWDEVFPASVINFQDFETVEIAGRGYRMMGSAQRLVALRLGIPHDYLKKCPRHLQEVNLNHWIRAMGNARLFLRFDGQELRAMFTLRYKPINNVRVLERMFEGGFFEEDEVYFTLTNEVMVLNLPNHQGTFRLRQEEIAPGVSIVNSEVGVAAFAVHAFFLRLICTNGLIAAEKTMGSDLNI